MILLCRKDDFYFLKKSLPLNNRISVFLETSVHNRAVEKSIVMHQHGIG